MEAKIHQHHFDTNGRCYPKPREYTPAERIAAKAKPEWRIVHEAATNNSAVRPDAVSMEFWQMKLATFPGDWENIQKLIPKSVTGVFALGGRTYIVEKGRIVGLNG